MPPSGAESSGLSSQHVFALMGMRDVEVTTGDYAMEMPIGPHVANNRGGLQGGLLATLVDIVAGCAALKGLPAGVSAATADMNLHFLSAVTVGPARAEATVVRRGKRSIVTKVEVRDLGRDVLAAIATATFTVIELRPGQIDSRGIADDGTMIGYAEQ